MVRAALYTSSVNLELRLPSLDGCDRPSASGIGSGGVVLILMSGSALESAEICAWYPTPGDLGGALSFSGEDGSPAEVGDAGYPVPP
jgi:hypothetical protein